MQQIQAASVGPGGARLLGTLPGLPHQVASHRFCKSDSVMTATPTPRHIFSCFAIPAVKGPSTLPAAHANNLLWALSFMPHF